MPEDPEVKATRLQRQMKHARTVKAGRREEYGLTHQSIHISLRINSLEKLMVEAKRRGIFRTDLVREIVEEYVSKLPERGGGSGW
jgi:hypothetical protein